MVREAIDYDNSYKFGDEEGERFISENECYSEDLKEKPGYCTFDESMALVEKEVNNTEKNLKYLIIQ